MSFIESIKSADESLFHSINGAHCSVMDSVMVVISEPWFGIPFYLLGLYLTYKVFGVKGTLIFVAGCGAAVALSDLTSVHLFKNMFLRYRPTHNLDFGEMVHVVDGYRGGAYGFVSSHAANMFALATVFTAALQRHYKHTWWIAVSVAVLIGYSRIYLGVHFPADVIGGAMVGFIIGTLIFIGVNRFMVVEKK